MDIAIAGHGWEERYVLVTGEGPGALREEAAAPGGAYRLAEYLRRLGHAVTAPHGPDGEAMRRYYACFLPTGGAPAWAAAGSAPGRTTVRHPAEGFTVVLDEGFEPVEIAASAKRLLWASRSRVPDLKAAAAFPADTALLLDADALRDCGALISREVSWERTATDALWQIVNNPAFRHLLTAREIIIPFAEEGFLAVTLAGGSVTDAALWLASGDAEGAARAARPGEHPEAWPLAVAATAAAAAAGESPVIPKAFPAARKSVLGGPSFTDIKGDGGVAASAALLAADYGMGRYALPLPPDASAADKGYWRILDSFSSVKIDTLAERIVEQGLSAIAGVPSIRFGKLVSVDRAEIESFMNVRNLITGYAASSESRPLSIAVFGAPGSGKSFGVMQIAENVLPNRVKKIEFNISQFTQKSDLAAALHRVRDVALGGFMPLVIFDEFDSDFDGRRLGWLKSFLMPMQDGKFTEGEAEHPVGRCIFVFAGGTSASFEEFSSPLADGAPEAGRREFALVKGPDFISRLRGTLNVLGPNRRDEADRSFLIRRALLLRSLCERKIRHCFDGDAFRIDRNLLVAMLLAPRYRHGARSMESIIDMSRTAPCRAWEPSSLPQRSQLALHVDAAAFERLLLRDVLLGGNRELLARTIHENYRKIQAEQALTPSPLARQTWEELSAADKDANRAQADDIMNKLGRFGFGFDAGDSFFETVDAFPPEKLEAMAEAEHERWMRDRAAAGWTYAPEKKDEAKKTSPYMVEWEKLDDGTRELDRDAIRNIIPLLNQIGLRVYRRD